MLRHMNASEGSANAQWYDEFYKDEQFGFPSWYLHSIPHLKERLTSRTRLIELGCGQGQLLRTIVNKGYIPEENVYGMDQSQVAVDFVKARLPKAQVGVGDLYDLKYPSGKFDVVLLMETIEHLNNPARALSEIYRITQPVGLLYLSFPNYLHLPWLLVRHLAERLNKHNWICLQPIDHIYFPWNIIKMCEQAGFTFKEAIGANYGPPVFHALELSLIHISE